MRPLIIVVFSIILAYILFQGIRLLFLVRTSAQLVEKSMRYERLSPEGTPRILVIGDSTGVGTGVSDPLLSIAGRFGSDFPKAYIQNESVNGWRVANLVEHFPDVPAQSFDIILLQIGANDIMRGTSQKEFSASLDTALKLSTTAGKKVYALHSGNIGLAPFFPWPLSQIMRNRTLLFRAEYQRIAAENGVTYIDLYHEKADDPFKGKRSFYADDLLHLSGDGYAEWYRSIRAAMQ